MNWWSKRPPLRCGIQAMRLSTFYENRESQSGLTVAFRTKETFVDGWLRTGDEVIFNEDGDMFVVDRLKVCCRRRRTRYLLMPLRRKCSK